MAQVAKALPPLTSMDRMGSGEHLGQCPTCGGVRWWDNRGRKRAGEEAPDAADYRCTGCGHRRWEDGRHEAGRAGARRRPTLRTTDLGAAGPTATSGTRCAATTKSGAPCGGAAMAGSAYCGPHSGASGSSPARRCLGTTKAGTPCGAGPMRGEQYCPQHLPD